MEKKLYEKQEIYDPAAIAELSEHYAAILRLLGEDPTREGLLKTPERVAKAMAFMTKGYAEDPRDILLSAMFREEYRQMVLVRDIEVYSLQHYGAMGRRAGRSLRLRRSAMRAPQASSRKIGNTANSRVAICGKSIITVAR